MLVGLTRSTLPAFQEMSSNRIWVNPQHRNFFRKNWGYQSSGELRRQLLHTRCSLIGKKPTIIRYPLESTSTCFGASSHGRYGFVSQTTGTCGTIKVVQQQSGSATGGSSTVAGETRGRKSRQVRTTHKIEISPGKTSGVRMNKHQTRVAAEQLSKMSEATHGALAPMKTTPGQQTTSPATPLNQPPQVARSGGFLGVLAEGVAHGVGWAFGQRAVDAIMGPRTMEVVHHNDEQPSASQDVGGASEPPPQEFQSAEDPAEDQGGGFFDDFGDFWNDDGN